MSHQDVLRGCFVVLRDLCVSKKPLMPHQPIFEVVERRGIEGKTHESRPALAHSGKFFWWFFCARSSHFRQVLDSSRRSLTLTGLT